MAGLFNILLHTPSWVFGLFALLSWLGLQAMRARSLPIWRLLVTPAIFIGWGAASLVAQASPILIADWLFAAATGAAIAWSTSRLHGVTIDRTNHLVSLPGSAVPLVRNLLIFLAKYALGVTAVIIPASHPQLAFWDIAISGVSAGYFLGWLIRFASLYGASNPNLVVQP